MNNFPLISKYKEKLPAFDFSCACVVLSCTCIGAYAGGRHTKRPLFRRKLTSVTTPWVFPKDLEVFNSALAFTRRPWVFRSLLKSINAFPVVSTAIGTKTFYLSIY